MSSVPSRRLSRRRFLQAGVASGLAASTLIPAGRLGTLVQAQAAVTPQAALERLFGGGQAQADWFAPSFLSQVSLAQVQGIIDQLEATLGAYQRVQGSPSGYTVVFAQASVPVNLIQLDDQGRFTALLIGTPQFANQDLGQRVAALLSLPGQVSLLVLRNGDPLVSQDPDKPLAVGSSFKLAVLTALRRQIEAGQHAWDEVVELQPEWKSLPSGILQNWPDGSALTLQTLASLMISQSDNTAADALISALGRDAVDAVAPARDRPFLTTREAFVLKDPANADLRQQYLNGDVTQRLAALQQADTLTLPDANNASFLSGPLSPEVEWFFTVRELCTLMAGVADLPLMGIDPGVAAPQQWSQIAYKGGSEPGVLNMTYSLQNAAGAADLVSVTWNNDATDTQQLALLVGSLLAALA
jgi:beta-lactamase class A